MLLLLFVRRSKLGLVTLNVPSSNGLLLLLMVKRCWARGRVSRSGVRQTPGVVTHDQLWSSVAPTCPSTIFVTGGGDPGHCGLCAATPKD